MSFPNAQNNPAAAVPVYIAAGPAGSANPTPPTPPPATIAASGVWNSGPMNAVGLSRFSASATLSQDGTLELTLYIDPAGTIAVDGSGPVSMTPDSPAVATSVGGAPAASWRVTVTNTSGSTGNLTAVALLAQP